MIIAGTGHRPAKLFATAKNPYEERWMRDLVTSLRVDLKGLAPTKVISGMALGFDQALAVAALREGIPLIAAIPFEGQEVRWPWKSREDYRKILSHASEIVVVSKGDYAPQKMHARNRWMITHCDLLVALFDGSKGGTASCIRDAERVHRPIKYLDFGHIKGRPAPQGPVTFGPAQPDTQVTFFDDPVRDATEAMYMRGSGKTGEGAERFGVLANDERQTGTKWFVVGTYDDHILGEFEYQFEADKFASYQEQSCRIERHSAEYGLEWIDETYSVASTPKENLIHPGRRDNRSSPWTPEQRKLLEEERDREYKELMAQMLGRVWNWSPTFDDEGNPSI